MEKYGNYNRTLADRFMQIRTENKLTRDALAEILHCSPQSIYNMEAAKRGITAKTAELFSREFHFDMNYLLDEKVEFKSSLDKLNSDLKTSAHENSLINIAIVTLAELNGYDVKLNNIYECDGNIKTTFEKMRKYMIFTKDGKESFSLSLEEANRFGNNLSDLFLSNLEMLADFKTKYSK